MNKIRTIFIGTPDFAVPSLGELIKDNYFEIVAVITQPDRRSGRGQNLTPPPIKVLADKNNILVLQPEKLCCIEAQVMSLKPDLIIVAAYAQIIGEKILNIPKYGAINVHGSLLPKYRGASCIQAAILNGDSETGVTIMKMDKGLDTGPILFQDKISIEKNDTTGTVYDKLSHLGARILLPTVKKYIEGDIKPVSQDDSISSYAGMLKKKDGKIDWNCEANFIERFIRAMSPWPGAFSSVNKINFKIKKARAIDGSFGDKKMGEIFLVDNDLAIKCAKNAIIIEKIHPEGKKEMNASDFLSGHKNIIGLVLE